MGTREAFELPQPVSLRRTLGAVVQGRADPCSTWDGERLWMCRRSKDGPVTFSLETTHAHLIVRSWGAGSDALTSIAKDIAGFHYTQQRFEEPEMEARRKADEGRRVPRTHASFDTLVWTTLAQRVTGMEAKRSWRNLAQSNRETAPVAPGGPPLLLPPSAEFLADLPYFTFHEFGIDRARARTIRTLARCERRISEMNDLSLELAKQRMRAIPGIGEWTINEVSMYALGDIDAVSVGDFHLANQIGWALAKRPRSTDAEMIELLEPFRGRRGEVTRFIVGSSTRPPAYGPRYAPLPIAHM